MIKAAVFDLSFCRLIELKVFSSKFFQHFHSGTLLIKVLDYMNLSSAVFFNYTSSLKQENIGEHLWIWTHADTHAMKNVKQENDESGRP